MDAWFWFAILLFVIVIFWLSNASYYSNVADDLKLRRQRFNESKNEE